MEKFFSELALLKERIIRDYTETTLICFFLFNFDEITFHFLKSFLNKLFSKIF
jgi:hypothetical protein